MSPDNDAQAYKEYVDALPLWGAGWQQDTSSIDGLVPSCRVESWQQFIEILREDQFNRASRELVFRGQRGCNWPLASTLGRKFNSGAIPPNYRRDMLRNFELAMRGRGYDLGLLADEEEKWAIGQHHGLATPLLDWTRSPFVALIFAFNREDGGETENPSRAVFCLNRTAITAAFDDDEDFFREPLSSNNSRLVNQAGLFTLSPSGEDNISAYIINRLTSEEIVTPEAVTMSIEGSSDDDPKYEVRDDTAVQIATYIFKMHIPNRGRLECLEMLRKMNIHNGSLFPDANGASLYCNDWLDRVLAEEKRAEAAEEAVKPKAEQYVVSGPEGLPIGPSTESPTSPSAAALASYLAENELTSSISNTGSLAEKIERRFRENRSVDWKYSESKLARVRTGIRRLLLSLDLPKDFSEQLTDDVVKYYKANDT